MSKENDFVPLTEAFYYILVTLYAGPLHGYGIMQEVEKISSGKTIIGAGTLYTALNTLAKRKYIENVNPSSADSRRKVYSITAPGRAALLAEINRLEELLENGRQAIHRQRGDSQ
ncbi:PadR family transcriptional regulator [Alicyclobacillus fastidiosus]|uniref:Helix-turn-helix transcriptional regulator n=1 Tax=Alicyclobacillus fastidiosus TaxID=392011 RepID=A0ABV5ABV0_9BACL|nr:helix-turn-helix transcriptional regulator [Alicyclobacillus fastidiosus]WEH10293.1 helix-turn-helix transcriptional regulator [Alicyclobacillus fastidiosus]